MYEKTENDDPKRFNLLLGLYDRHKSEDGGNKSRYLWLFSKKKHDGELTEHALFPFYSRKSTDADGARETNLLTGLFGTQTKTDGSRNLRLLWLFRIKTKDARKEEEDHE